MALTALFLAEALQAAEFLEGWLGMPGITSVVRQCLALVAAGAVRSLLAGVREDVPERPTPPPTHLLVGAVAAVAILVPFVLCGTGASEVLQGTTSRYDAAAVASVLSYWGAYLAYLSWALAGSTRLCWVYGRQAAPGPTRTGLMLTGAGTALGFAYVLDKLVFLALWVSGDAGNLFETKAERAESLLLLVVLLLIAVGSGYEALTERLAVVRRWRQDRRSMRRLHPLWVLVDSLFPDHILDRHSPQAAPLRAGPTTTRYLVVRRRAEIEDGLRQLSSHLDRSERLAALEEAAATVAQAEDSRLWAAAAHIHLARRAMRSGRPADPSQSSLTDALPAAATAAEETAWLEGMTRAYTSPLSVSIAERARARAAAGGR